MKNLQLLEKFSEQSSTIENWFEQAWKKTPPPFYCSVDLRYSTFKLAPVDTNLFPAGFNLLSPTRYTLSAQAINAYLDSIEAKVRRILLIPENHTRNMGYLENVAALKKIIEQAGIEVRIGTLIDEIKSPTTLSLPSQNTITLFPIERKDNQLVTENFVPDLILLNNDLTSGIPSLLKNIDQPLFPPLKAGWSTRLKSQHFEHYQRVTEEFSDITGIASWLIFPLFQYCQDVNLISHGGEDCIETKAKMLLETVQAKYAAYAISEPPFLMVKSDSGTYGIGVMTLRTPEKIHHLNRKERTHMSSGKGGVDIRRVLIQEGIYTSETETESGGAAEAVMYMIGKQIVGGFYRIHPKRKSDENLNAPGMYFDTARFEKLAEQDPTRFYAYSVVARLAMLAAARELNGDR